MNYLFVDLALRYVNPTRNYQPCLFGSGTLKFYGPGYVSEACLELGVEAFIKSNGPFDAVIVTEHIAFSKMVENANAEKSFRQNYTFSFSSELFSKRIEIYEELKSVALFKVLLTLETDYFHLTEEHISIAEDEFDLVVGWGEQFISKLPAENDGYGDGFLKAANNNWFEFSKRAFKKIVPIAHFVGENEFCFSDIFSRSTDFVVPGASYDKRKTAKYELSKMGLMKSEAFSIPYIGIARRFGIYPLNWEWFQDYYMRSFKQSIKDAKIAYTCGSSLNWPIRKYFEIPALGAVLFCNPCNGFEALGFKNGHNSIVCSPEDLPALGVKILSNPSEASAIASAGRELIFKHHTLSVRAQQCSNALECALAGNWNGAVWDKGLLKPI